MAREDVDLDPEAARLAPSTCRTFVSLELGLASSEIGQGVFAGEPIARGTIVGVDGGRVLLSSRGAPPGRALLVVIDEGRYLAPQDFDRPEPFWLVNHSCESNVARLGGLVYVAKRDIARGEELTVDYAPLVSGQTGWEMQCRCGTPHCRRVIRESDWHDRELAERLWPEWLPFVQRLIAAASSAAAAH